MYVAYYKQVNCPGAGYKRIAFMADSIQTAWHIALQMKHDDGDWVLVDVK